MVNMGKMWRNFLYCIYISAIYVLLVNGRDRPNDLNTCLDAKGHKSAPEPEPSLEGECVPWRNLSCCLANNTKEFHKTGTDWLDFNWSHCSKALSSECRQWFLRDLCFYECSPNQGPWIVPDNIGIRNERFLHVPLCKQDCDSWWNACRNELTCLQDWSNGFNWTTGTNVCPSDRTCQPFTVVYGNASTFCEQVWGGSWKVVPDNEACMRIHFTGSNPNDAVAKQYSKSSGVSRVSANILWFVIVLMILA